MGILICLMPLQILLSQEPAEMDTVPYSPEFEFKDGIYLNIDYLRNNDPIPLARIITEIGFSNKDFIAELLSNEQIMLYDDYGIRRTLNTKDIWGYAENGRLYIMVGGHFQRIILQGSISLFSASATTYEKTSFPVKDTGSSSNSTNDLYRSFYGKDYYYRNITGERREYLFDFESNSLSEYHYENLGVLIEQDSLLSSEYETLKTREKKRRMLEFIRRYNQNHPLYFPDN